MFIGSKNGRISVVSDKHFSNSNFDILEISEKYEAEDLILNYKIVNNQLLPKFPKKPASELKIALVTNWKMKCGIATYSENLYRHIVPQVKDFKLFIEHNEIIGDLYSIKDLPINSDQIQACWKRGESLNDLVVALKEYNPDLIWIQHEFGLWPNARHWLAMMTQLSDYRVIVTMHSVFHHQDKTICEANLNEIIVHLEGGKQVLKEEKKVPAKVYVIPHGTDIHQDQKSLWNFYKSKHTFMQFGFGFRYKGWENSLQAVAILKKKYPDIFFTALFSESQNNKVEHELYYNELMDLANRLEIQENVAIVKSYQSEQTLDSYIRTNQVCVFPYISSPEHEVFGVSGAARLAMAKGRPVITSSVNHFSDLPTIKADGPEEIAKALDKIYLANSKYKIEQLNKQQKYLEENSWENTAQKHLNLFSKKMD